MHAASLARIGLLKRTDVALHRFELRFIVFHDALQSFDVRLYKLHALLHVIPNLHELLLHKHLRQRERARRGSGDRMSSVCSQEAEGQAALTGPMSLNTGASSSSNSNSCKLEGEVTETSRHGGVSDGSVQIGGAHASAVTGHMREGEHPRRTLSTISFSKICV